MKFYQTPETTSLSVNAQTFLCGSSEPTPTPGRGASIQSMSSVGTIVFS